MFMLNVGGAEGSRHRLVFPGLRHLLRSDVLGSGGWLVTGRLDRLRGDHRLPPAGRRDAWTADRDVRRRACLPGDPDVGAPKWINYTGCDSLYSVAADAKGAYFGGHERFSMNQQACDTLGLERL